VCRSRNAHSRCIGPISADRPGHSRCGPVPSSDTPSDEAGCPSKDCTRGECIDCPPSTPVDEASERPNAAIAWRKKPVEIEARQLNYANRYDVAAWCGGEAQEAAPSGSVYAPGLLSIGTLEGTMWANGGDWIIKGVQGEFYPCKPDIFAATYEPAVAPASPPHGDSGRRPVDGGERSQSEQWFVVHHNQIRSLRFGTFPIERLARASIAACTCGPHTLRHTVTTTYTASTTEEFVAAAADRGEG
jgi:hypothetical protein